MSGAVKRDFRTYIQRYTSPNENVEYGYPHSYALLQFHLKLERCKPHKAAHHLTKCDVTNDIKLFPTVYQRIYCRKFLTLSNQTLRYKIKCIRISYLSKQCFGCSTENSQHMFWLMNKKNWGKGLRPVRVLIAYAPVWGHSHNMCSYLERLYVLLSFLAFSYIHMHLDAAKPAFWVYKKVRFRSACSATETS